MLKINRQVDYALQLLIALAVAGKKKPLSIRKFSEESNISFLFLQKIARLLREAGLVKSLMGAGGGYILAKPASEISVKDIMVAIEGDCGISACAVGVCNKVADCKIRRSVMQINREIINHLDNVKISHMAN